MDQSGNHQEGRKGGTTTGADDDQGRTKKPKNKKPPEYKKMSLQFGNNASGEERNMKEK